MDNNKNNDFLNELLNKKQKGELDDFEREALEGFDTLSSDEAHQLKTSLDAHMKEEVFAEKRPTRVYWLAAAALALVVGLSVIFVMNNGSNGKDLAITTISEEKAPEGIMQGSPVLSPPAEEKAAEPEKKLDDANKNTKDAVLKTEQKVPGFKSSDAQEQNRNGAGGKSEEVQKSTGTSAGVVDEEITTSRKANGTDVTLNNNSNNNYKQQGPASVTVPNPSRDANPETEKLKKEAEKSESAGEKGKADEERNEVRANLAAHSGAVSKNATVTEDPKKEKAGQSTNNETSSREKKKSRAIRKKDNQPAQVDNKPVDKLEESKNDRSEDKDQEEAASENAPTSPKTADDSKGYGNAENYVIYYSGGEAAFKKDVSVKLIEKGLNKKFDAVLFVNKNGKVEKVKMLNTHGMDNNDVDKIENILRALDKFETNDKKGLTEIKLNYRP
jgi:hypothetical protein